MGMSIEDIIQGLKETNMICNSVFAYDRKKYIDGAIDKLCKYQKIQEIVNSKTTRLSYEVGFRQIKKVVEDGNNSD